MSDPKTIALEAVLRLLPTIIEWWKGLSDDEKKSVEEAYGESAERLAEHMDDLRKKLDEKFGADS